MSEPERPKERIRNLAQELQDLIGDEPPDTFAAGAVAMLQQRPERALDLHEPRPDDNGNGDNGNSVHLDGEAPRTIRFPPWWRIWFAKQNQRTLVILDRVIHWLERHGEEKIEQHLADLDEVIERHRAWKKFWAWVWWAGKVGGPAAGILYGAITVFSEKAPRVIEQLPVLASVWKAIMGAK